MDDFGFDSGSRELLVGKEERGRRGETRKKVGFEVEPEKIGQVWPRENLSFRVCHFLRSPKFDLLSFASFFTAVSHLGLTEVGLLVDLAELCRRDNGLF